jgi:hypothetical protein
MEPQRDRTHAATADDEEECEKQSCDEWDLADHRREATRIQNRRSIPLGSRGEVPTPQEGKADPLEHSHLGLVGWIGYWSLGNSALAIKIIVGLIRKLDMTERVRGTDTHSNDARGREKRQNSHAHEDWSC